MPRTKRPTLKPIETQTRRKPNIEANPIETQRWMTRRNTTTMPEKSFYLMSITNEIKPQTYVAHRQLHHECGSPSIECKNFDVNAPLNVVWYSPSSGHASPCFVCLTVTSLTLFGDSWMLSCFSFFSFVQLKDPR